jgi:uncharacterized protein
MSSATGIVMREAHYPGRAPIDSYGRGGFRFAGMSHRGSLLCLPSGIYGWDVADAELIDEATLHRVFAEAGSIDVLLVGTGREIGSLAAGVRARLSELRIVAETMSTGAAVRTFNVLLAEDRPVAAALIAVD